MEDWFTDPEPIVTDKVCAEGFVLVRLKDNVPLLTCSEFMTT